MKKITSHKLLTNVVTENNGVICYLNGLDENALLKNLMDLGESIVEFRRVKTSLEDIFIRLTNEKTS